MSTCLLQFHQLTLAALGNIGCSIASFFVVTTVIVHQVDFGRRQEPFPPAHTSTGGLHAE